MIFYLERTVNEAIDCVHNEADRLFSNFDLLTKLRRVQTIIKRIKVSELWKKQQSVSPEGERDLSVSVCEVRKCYDKNVCSLPAKVSLKISDIINTYNTKRVPKE